MASRDTNFHKQYSQRQQTLRVLLDMDQVLADFEGHFLDRFKETFPDEPWVEPCDRVGLWVKDQYEDLKPGLNVKCMKVYNTKGFFQNLPEIPGAVAAARELDSMDGVDVFVCTTSIANYKYCAKEKMHWLEHHLGRKWLDKLILTKDKTVVNGHLIIDDKPHITGAISHPSWEHVVFSACHNLTTDIRGKRRLDNWTDGKWRGLIEDFKKRI